MGELQRDFTNDLLLQGLNNVAKLLALAVENRNLTDSEIFERIVSDLPMSKSLSRRHNVSGNLTSRTSQSDDSTYTVNRMRQHKSRSSLPLAPAANLKNSRESAALIKSLRQKAR